MSTSRRQFLQTTVSTAVGLAACGQFLRSASAAENGASIAAPSTGAAATSVAAGDSAAVAAEIVALSAAGPPSVRNGDMVLRTLGRTGVKVSAIGLGGFHIGVPEEKEGIRIVRAAIDGGITFMDNSWDYHEGESERRMGRALQDGYRDKVFLMTKINGRTKVAAATQIDESLQRLKVDHVDLMQFHEMIRLEDADRLFAEGGGMEAMEAAQKAGKVRFIGFTGHKDPAVHLRVLEVASDYGFHFDVLQMPLNIMDAHFRSFARQVAPQAIKKGIGIVSMKPLGGSYLLKSKTVTPVEALHFAMNLPTSVVITGIDRLELVGQALEAAKTFKPLTRDEVVALLDRTAQAARRGQFERYKVDNIFDNTAKNPQSLG